jgi:hypothetical protein
MPSVLDNYNQFLAVTRKDKIMRTPVVTIETEAGPVRIDRDAYDPATDTLAEDQDEDFEPFTDTAPPAPPAPPAPAVPFEPVTPPAIAPAPPAPPVTKPV